MLKILRNFALPFLAGLAIALPAEAEDGVYIGGQGGVNFTPDMTFSGPVSSPLFRTDQKTGYAAGVVLGYDFGHWSTELEFTHRDNDINILTVVTDGGMGAALGVGAFAPGVLPPARGDVRSNAFMWNLYYNFAPEKKFNPFVGLGVGVASIKLNGIGGGGPGVPAFITGQKDTNFAAQGIAGFRQQLSDAVYLVLSYRYTHMGDFAAVIPTGAIADPDVNNHSIMLGILVKFGKSKPAPAPAPVVQPTPPPPPPAPVVAPPPRTIPGPFIVFFEWDSDVLDEQALAVLREASAAFREYGIARVIAIGHADRSGPEIYNEGLSVRRAQSVLGAFVGLGIPQDVINIEGRGERENRMPTADGVRERQNRRVEITLIE